jgi:competence protein ComEC
MIVAVTYYAALAAAWTLWRRASETGLEPLRARRWRRGSAAVAATAAFWILAQPWTLWAARGDGRLHVTFIDVGQGDAAFVRFPRGAALLVDAGGLPGGSSFDIGDRVVAPVLREAGVGRLDYFALTHGDPDHIGGAGSVLTEFRPRAVWEGIPVPRSAPLTALRAHAAAAGLHWTTVRRGDRFSIDGVDVHVVHPDAPDWERQKVRNDDSIVLELRWHEVSVLLAGDIGRETERALPPLAPSRFRVVKVPHHGSLTSSGEPFLRQMRPTHAVFSAGRSNTFGHPVPEVVKRYEDAGAAIFRTDRDGAITVETDGYSVDIRTFVDPHTVHHEGTTNTKNTK